MKLTDKECRAFQPKANSYKKADGKGLYLLITSNGSKYWRMNYRFHDKFKTLAIGVYPNTSLKEARAECEKAKTQLEKGLDPAHEKKKAKLRSRISSGNSFESVASEWLKKRVHHLSPKHRSRIESVLHNDINPCIGKAPIHSIEAPELLLALQLIEKRGASYTAERTRQWCSQIFRYAIACGKAKRDIAHDLRGTVTAHQPKNMAYLKEDELPQFFVRLQSYQGHTQTMLALKLIALTFVRPSELCAACINEFESNLEIWRIPKERMKMGIEHIVPLSNQAKSIIEKIKGMNNQSNFLFPGFNNPAKPMNQDTLLRGLYRMGYKGQATTHGFRATASTILYENEFFPDAIEKQLAHAERNQVKAAYNHAQHINQRRDMMQWWADHLEKLGLTI